MPPCEARRRFSLLEQGSAFNRVASRRCSDIWLIDRNPSTESEEGLLGKRKDEGERRKSVHFSKEADIQDSLATERFFDGLFGRICWLSDCLGVNFDRERAPWKKVVSSAIIAINVLLNLYFCVFIVVIVLSSEYNRETIAVSLGWMFFTLQATCSTLFLVHWQRTDKVVSLMRQLYAAHAAAGIAYHRVKLTRIVRNFYAVVVVLIVMTGTSVAGSVFVSQHTHLDQRIVGMLGDRRLFLIFQFSHLYCIVCWAVVVFVFVLLVYGIHYEFAYFNREIRRMRSDDEDEQIEFIMHHLIVHRRLLDCVFKMDRVFNRYTFTMFATIIPNTIFSFYMFFSESHELSCLFFALPVIIYCIFSFFALTTSPSKLHTTIYETKSALCANTNIWFPYRSEVVHAALAFMSHLDQPNIGISVWGFAIISKPLVLTTLSVIVMCLALFLQVCPTGGEDHVVEVVDARHNSYHAHGINHSHSH